MENNTNQKITTPVAIVVAGVLIMVGILLTNNGNKVVKEKTLSEQVGVNKTAFDACIKDTKLEDLYKTTSIEADAVMKNLPANERGTPYSVIIGKNGAKTDIRGALAKEEVLKLIKEVTDGKVTNPYTGNIPLYKDGEHIIGNPNAPVMIIEYSDLECPYCKRLNGTMKEIIAESNGQVAWVYRHWIVHPNALPKAGAAECVAKLNGNDAFWKYVDLIFGLIQTQEDTSGLNKL